MRIFSKTAELVFLTVVWVIVQMAGCNSSITPGVEPEVGQSEFISAYGQGSGRNSLDYGADGEPSEQGDKNNGDTRTVEEGDIYRVLGGNLILNLNSYRGFQVIDFSDVSRPKIIGRISVSGTPVEMYVVGTRAYVLLNDWYGYYGGRKDILADKYQGGLVLGIDISDPASPQIVGRAKVPGWIQTSRLTRGGGKEALFVAANNWESQSMTVVRSFSIQDSGDLSVMSTIDLGGYVIDVQATPEAMMVARYDWQQGDGRSTVSVIDISDPDGFMIEGAEVEVAGTIKNKTNMDLYKNILRISSGRGWWNGNPANHIQTFNVSDIFHPIPVDDLSFADGQDLYASLFLGNKAFLVTYLRVDPLHAFEITDEGAITAKSEYVITGWNDFFTPVFGGTRMIGVGIDDQNGRRMAASLYDIVDLSNPNPFLGRAAVEFDYTWSEAQWDDKAFSVLENAVSVAAPNGSTETGLVLLPFSGYSQGSGSYVAAVQIFTYSENSITRRGVMEQGTQVQRSFLAGDYAANLSQEDLSFFDHRNPDQPVELGRLELAPNYQDFFIFGSFGARLKNDRDYYGWWGQGTAKLPDNQLQIISLENDPDNAEPLATISLPAYAQVYHVGALAVAVSTEYIAGSDPLTYRSEIRVFDLSNPAQPVPRGSLITDKIKADDYGYGYGMEDCFDCGWYRPTPQANLVGQALVFSSRQWESDLLGVEHICTTWPEDYGCYGYEEGGAAEDCYSGSITCSSLNGRSQTCSGAISKCVAAEDGQWSCAEIDPDSIPTQEYCYDQEKRRYWSYMKLNALDLRNPDAPVMAPEKTLPRDEEDISLLADGATLYVTFLLPVDVVSDSRPYVRYFFRAIDWTDPSRPVTGPSINIPGELLQVNGNSIFTRDYMWGNNSLESAVNRLRVEDGRAYLEARRRFRDRVVQEVKLDGNGHILVSHSVSWYGQGRGGVQDQTEQMSKLSVLDALGTDLPLLSEIDIDSWASLRDAKDSRVFFTVPSGLLIVNLENPEAPVAQAYYPVIGWPTRMVPEGSFLYIPAGRYGLYRFDVTSLNLLTEE
jgi:hypothetical protein